MSQEQSPAGSRMCAASQALSQTHTLAVLATALAARLLVAWTVVRTSPPQWLFSRGMEMGLLAKSLLAGRGLSSPFGGETGPTAFVAPIYPILVAAVFKFFGHFSLASEIVILGAQIVLNLATIWLIMHVARQLFNQAAATIAGLVWACSLPLIWMPTIFWETSLSCCLLTGLVALVLHYKRQPEVGHVDWLKLGAFCGLAALVNPALLPSLAAIIVWLAWTTRRASGSRPLLAALTFVLVFAPWPIRNARVFHAFIPLRTTVGFELWMGNHAGATGFLDESLFPTFNSQELADYNVRGEVQYTRHKSDLAKQYIYSHPLNFIRLTVKRAARFWAGAGTQHGSPFFLVHAVLTTLAGLAGLIVLSRSRRFDVLVLFALPLVLFPLPYLVTHAEFRYRLVIDPLLTITAGYAAAELYRLLARKGHLAAKKLAPTNGVSLAGPRQVAWRRL